MADESTLPPGPGQPSPDNLRIQLAEIGAWARHFSTVRMTVTSILLPVSLGILFVSRERPNELGKRLLQADAPGSGGSPAAQPALTPAYVRDSVILMIASLAAWFLALVILIAFTRYFWRCVDRWRSVQSRLFPEHLADADVLIFKKPRHWHHMDWLVGSGVLATILYLVVWFSWLGNLLRNG